MRQPQKVSEFMHSNKKHFIRRQADIRVERDPPLEGRSIRELRTRYLALGEEVRTAVNDLNRAAPAVVFTPLHIEDSGPEIQCPGEFCR